MTVNELMIEIKKQVARGYGNKNIIIDVADSRDYSIDSIQKNTHPSVEPEYLLIMGIARVNPGNLRIE